MDFKKALELFGYRPDYSYEYRNEIQTALKLAQAVQEGRFVVVPRVHIFDMAEAFKLKEIEIHNAKKESLIGGGPGYETWFPYMYESMIQAAPDIWKELENE